MTRLVTNIAASVRDRLLEDTKRKHGNFQLALRRYLIERFLYRLGKSPHRDQFVLKGAMLFVLWDATINRPTKDLDLAGFWTNDAASLLTAIKEILAIPCPEDGITFWVDTVTAEPIRHRTNYHGFRVRVQSTLATAKISLQIDVGFGDAIEPPAILETYPVALDAPAPRIRAYPREVAIAEKLHAMVFHGVENSRYKDFYDVFLLSSRFAFNGSSTVAAIKATFARRETSGLEPWPVALTTTFTKRSSARTSGPDSWNARSLASMRRLVSCSSVTGYGRFSRHPSVQPSSVKCTPPRGLLADHGDDQAFSSWN